jgi:hypothetical protein
MEMMKDRIKLEEGGNKIKHLGHGMHHSKDSLHSHHHHVDLD